MCRFYEKQGAGQLISPSSISIESLFEKGLVWIPDEAASSYVQEKKGGSESLSAEFLISNPSFKAANFRNGRALQVTPFSIPEIDSVLPGGGLPLRTLHELYNMSGDSSESRNSPTTTSCCVLPATFARRRIKDFLETQKTGLQKEPFFPYLLIWIGRACWPSPLFLNELLSFQISDGHQPDRGRSILHYNFLHRCLFIDPSDKALSLWTLETALRSPAVGFVAATLENMPLAASRKLSLAARAGNSLCFILRDPKDRAGPCTASSRWLIEPLQTNNPFPCWNLSLDKIKGTSPSTQSWQIALRNSIESSDNQQTNSQAEAISLHLLPRMGDRNGAAAVTEREELTRRFAI